MQVTMEQFEVNRRDLRQACIHEAAHEAVAIFLGGGAAECAVWPSKTHNYLEERMWVGQTRFYMPLASPERCRLIGLAGIVAEEFAGNADILPDNIFASLESGALQLSHSDALTAGPFDQADVEQCLQIVRQLWAEILQGAERLTLLAKSFPGEATC
jgi:hypothetical protein